MAGAFINGPVLEPKVEVEQIFIQRNPLVPQADLPVVVVGQNRQIEFEEDIGAYAGAAVSLELPSLTLYSATLIELASQAYIDEDGVAQATPSLPNVVFRHPKFGDWTIPKKVAGVLGWTFDQVDGEFDLDAGITALYEILTGVGDYTATILAPSTTAGTRTFTDATADFIGAGVQAGDTVVVPGARMTIDAVVNETTLRVIDAATTTILTTQDGDDVNYTIEKLVSTGGNVVVTYIANRSDRTGQLIQLDLTTLEDELGLKHWLNPLAYYADLALRNTGTAVIVVQVGDDTSDASWDAAIELLTNFNQPYDLVPLTQDSSILAAFAAHVNAMSTKIETKYRRLFTSYPLVIQSTLAQDGATFNSPSRPAADEVLVTVTAGNNNLHVLGVEQGMIFRDRTALFGGQARIVDIIPVSGAVDADVTLKLATPHTVGLIGTPNQGVLTVDAAQIVGCEFDVSAASPGDTVVLDGQTFIDGTDFLTTDNDDLLLTLQAAFGSRYNITQPGGTGTVVQVRETRGGFTLGAACAATGTATVESIGGAGAVVTLVATGLSPGIKSGDEFVLSDIQAATIFTFRYTNDLSLVNGALDGGDIVIQIGGPLLSNEQVRDLTVAAINAGNHTLDITASPNASSTSDVDVVHNVAGAGTPADQIVSVSAAPLAISSNPAGSGANGGTPLTDWDVVTNPLTVDQQATYMAQIPLDLNNRRIINCYPDVCDERFTDLSAGQQLAQQGKGVFGGEQVVLTFQPNYALPVAAAAARAGLLASAPLTGRQIVGPYRLRRIDETFTKAQLDRILSTGNSVFSQPIRPGGTVIATRMVTTNTLDLNFVEENVGAQVDKFTRALQLALRGVFGPNLIDPDGNFLEMVNTKIQGVINDFTRPANREARAINIIDVREDPDQKDKIQITIKYVPLIAGNFGDVTIYV